MKLTARMEKWIETRLWNQKLINEPITISQIISELTNLYGIRLTPGTQKKLEAKIEQIRSRIYKRHKQWVNRRSEWARDLNVPEQLVQRWFRAEWIDIQKKGALSAIKGIIFERDYYFRFIEPMNAEGKIPEDPEISITRV